MRALQHNTQHARCRRILVLEDDPILREMYAAVLGCVGHTVDSAEDGEAGWQFLTRAEDTSADSYDLLITDNNMPRLSGVDLIKRLGAAGMHVPVIMVSSAVPEEAHQLNLAAFIAKPFGMEELLATVNLVLPEVEPTRAKPQPPGLRSCEEPGSFQALHSRRSPPTFT